MNGYIISGCSMGVEEEGKWCRPYRTLVWFISIVFFTIIKSDAWFLSMALLSEFLKICILILVLVLLCYSQLVCEGFQTVKQSQKAEGCWGSQQVLFKWLQPWRQSTYPFCFFFFLFHLYMKSTMKTAMPSPLKCFYIY